MEKMKPVETIPGMGREGMKENDGWGEFNSDIFYIRTCINVTMYPQYNNNNKKIPLKIA
jgi:hypothetical protein